MDLNSKIVQVPGVGDVEIRELEYGEAERLFELEPKKMGKEIIKACLYQNGERIFDGTVGLARANRLFGLIDQVMEINGLGKQQD